MKDFLRFIGKLALFGSLLLTAAGLLFFLVLPADYSNAFGIVYRKLDSLRQAASPKIILLGGSNLIFGFDSPLLEQRLGRPVVNFAIQAGIPLEMQLNQIEPFLGPGDLVVMVPEYTFYLNPDGYLPSIALLVDSYPQGIFQLDPPHQKTLPELIKTMFQYRYDRLRKAGTIRIPSWGELFDTGNHLDPVFLSQFDGNGDFVAHLDRAGLPVKTTAFFQNIEQLNPRSLQVLDEISRRAGLKGGSAVLMFPSARQSNCAATGPVFTQLVQRLQSGIQAPVAGTPQRYCFPDEMFYDTEYHLLRTGRRLRTEQMAEDLLPFLK